MVEFYQAALSGPDDYFA